MLAGAERPPAAGGLAAGERRRRLRRRSRILRGPHLIFFRNRAAETDGTLADLVHQTAMYYEDRLQGGGFARVLLAGAAAAASASPREVDQVRRSLEERLATPVDTVDPRAAATLADRIAAVAGPAGHAGAARRAPAARPETGRRCPRDPHQPLDAAVLQRARGARLAARRGRHRARRDRVQRDAASSAIAERHANWRAQADARRGARGGAAAAGDAAARQRRSAADRAASTAARQANELIDRRTFSWTELFNQFETTLPADVRITCGAADSRRTGGILLTLNIVARDVDDVDEFMENLEETGAFKNPLSDRGALQRRRAARGRPSKTNYLPANAKPAAGSGRRRRRTGR